MKNLLFILAILATGPVFGQTAFGDKITADGAIPANLLASKMKTADSLAVKVTGTVVGVCQNKGCWMQLDIGEGKMIRVKFKDYAFFVPKDISGKTVVLDGRAYHSTTSVTHLRHYAQDAGKSKAEIEKITEPEVNIVFEARGVIVM
ncbi:MAG: hypothetical protein FD134_214 [Gallionellaceae bacterium]|nr:MAG: hypothetical protein FD134_214 [Gallionellaceae bacterium]